jgi:5-methylcytosine-specific restriction endonuclease McrA
MDKGVREAVRARAAGRCEYCHLPQTVVRERFQIEHIIARQHGGQDTEDNLALCCMRCNLCKGPNIAGIDPSSGQLTPLFNPRRDRWDLHFVWSGAKVVGVSAIGRTTVHVLDMNDPQRISLREWLIEEGA